MRCLPFVALCYVFVLGFLQCVSAECQAVPIPDKNLEAALRSVIFDKRESKDELSEDDLKKVYLLTAKGKEIRDLTGLEKCTNLQQLDLEKNDIVDIAA